MSRKRSKLIIHILIAFIIITVIAGIIIALGVNEINNYQEKMANLEAQIAANRQYVYVANGDILAGDEIQEDINAMKQEIASGLNANLYMTAEDLAVITTALVDIPAGQPIMKNMIMMEERPEDDLREVEINVAKLMVDSQTNDVVDVRVSFPDGSDYLVLSKKYMKNLIYDSAVWYTNLNEQEILTLTSAITDAYTVTGSYIYTTRYIAPTLQARAENYYPVNGIAHNMINGSGETTDPNVNRASVTFEKMKESLNLLARQRLEEELSRLSEDAMAAVAAGRGIQDTANATAYAGQQRYEAEYETSGMTDTTNNDIDLDDEEQIEREVNQLAEEIGEETEVDTEGSDYGN